MSQVITSQDLLSFGFDLIGAEGAPVATATSKESPAKIQALEPSFTLTGWLLPASGEKIYGIRVFHQEHKISARRKQMRMDVLRSHPEREDALYSGFKVTLSLRPGVNLVKLQYRDENNEWHDFAFCEIRLPRLWRLWKFFGLGVRRSSEYESWYARHAQISDATLHAQRKKWIASPQKPLISVLVPVYNTPEKWLRRMIESVQEQSYPHWELCLADDCSTEPHVRRVLDEAVAGDRRVKAVFREQNGHICHASNSALDLCTGEFTALLDHDDELPPDALHHVAESIAADPQVDMIFSDEDKIDEQGALFDPYFKMGWNPELLLYQNCFSHLGVLRTSLVREAGGFKPGTEGSQDWDLTWRLARMTSRERIRHLPRMLYHWRAIETSTASGAAAKPYAISAGQRAVEDHRAVVCPRAEVVTHDAGSWRVVWPLPEPPPLVSIIIPTRDRVDLLRVAQDSLFQKTAYPAFEVVIVDHASAEERTHAYFEEIKAAHPNLKVVRTEGPFNWSRLNNFGVSAASGSVLLFLNNDVEITDSLWLDEMARQSSRAEVGAVGACLLFPDGSIQHAGVVMGMTGVAGHVFRRGRTRLISMGGYPGLPREVTAVTGACMAVRRAVFEQAGGFDEEHLPVNYNDIDFCLRLRSLGYRNIYTPFAKLTHHESVSRAASEKESARKNEAMQEAQTVLSRWPAEFAGDAFYNANLSRESEWPTLRTVTD
jgi:GT2 family glycosyltransferase